MCWLVFSAVTNYYHITIVSDMHHEDMIISSSKASLVGFSGYLAILGGFHMCFNSENFHVILSVLLVCMSHLKINLAKWRDPGDDVCPLPLS